MWGTIQVFSFVPSTCGSLAAPAHYQNADDKLSAQHPWNALICVSWGSERLPFPTLHVNPVLSLSLWLPPTGPWSLPEGVPKLSIVHLCQEKVLGVGFCRFTRFFVERKNRLRWMSKGLLVHF